MGRACALHLGSDCRSAGCWVAATDCAADTAAMPMAPSLEEAPTDVEPRTEPDLHNTKVLICHPSWALRLQRQSRPLNAARPGRVWNAGRMHYRGWVTLAAEQHCSESSTLLDEQIGKLYCVFPRADGSLRPCPSP